MSFTIDSSRWTGRPPYGPDGPIELLQWEIRRFLYPTFDCEDCIGMADHGCYCAAYNAVAPCSPVEPWRHALRVLFGRIGWAPKVEQ